MTNRPSTLVPLCIAALLALAACGSDDDTASNSTSSAGDTADTTVATQSAGAYPVTVTSCGTDVTFDEAPSAVVAGWPTIINTLDALGVGESVIGYTSADLATAPATDAEPIAPDFRTSREVMIATGLDMFLVNDENQIDGSEGNVTWSDLATVDAGAYVLGGYCLDAPAPTDLQVVYDDIDTLGQIFGVTEQATELNTQLAQQIDTAASSLDDLAGATAAVVQAYDGTLYALSGSYYAMIPAALGLESVFGDLDANFAEISPEEVLTLAPDVVIIIHEGDSDDATAAVAEVSELLASAPAITNGQIATVQNGTLSGGGINVIDAITDVAEQLSSMS